MALRTHTTEYPTSNIHQSSKCPTTALNADTASYTFTGCGEEAWEKGEEEKKFTGGAQ